MKTLTNEPRLKFPFYCKNSRSIMLLKLGIKGLGALVKRIGFIQTTAAMEFMLLLCVEGSGEKKTHTDPLFFLATRSFAGSFLFSSILGSRLQKNSAPGSEF